MKWFSDLFFASQSIATSLFLLGLVGVVGQLVGGFKARGIKVGVAGVLFTGILFGHLGLAIHPAVLDFTREFGLILFVYAVGIAVGPGFFSSLRASGTRLNIVAVGIVFTGTLLTVGISKVADIPMPVAVGLFSGATTNTPALAAGSQALSENPSSRATTLKGLHQANPAKARFWETKAPAPGDSAALVTENQKMPGLGYSVAYPFGVLGLIAAMLILRSILGAKVKKEEEDVASHEVSMLQSGNFQVTNQSLFGKRLGEIALLEDLDLVVSRISHGANVEVARADHVLEEGSVLLAVGTAEALEQFRLLVGPHSDRDLRTVCDALTSRWLLLSNKQLVGKTLGQVRLIHQTGTCATRIRRGDIELLPASDLVLSYGDRVRIVGTPDNLASAEALMGNQAKTIDHPDVIVPFIGLVLGVLLGSIPFAVPAVPVPVKLGLAGGPLVVAILLGRLQKVGPFVTSLPPAANNFVKEFGITLFLAAVGLKSGSQFATTLVAGEGWRWMAWAALITAVPVALWIAIGRIFLKLRFASLIGVVSGSNTDPPALAFAQTLTRTQDASVGYATVYPLTMILRIVCAQLLVLFFAH